MAPMIVNWTASFICPRYISNSVIQQDECRFIWCGRIWSKKEINIHVQEKIVTLTQKKKKENKRQRLPVLNSIYHHLCEPFKQCIDWLSKFHNTLSFTGLNLVFGGLKIFPHRKCFAFWVNNGLQQKCGRCTETGCDGERLPCFHTPSFISISWCGWFYFASLYFLFPFFLKFILLFIFLMLEKIK